LPYTEVSGAKIDMEPLGSEVKKIEAIPVTDRGGL
jgi:hypothetical protein